MLVGRRVAAHGRHVNAALMGKGIAAHISHILIGGKVGYFSSKMGEFQTTWKVRPPAGSGCPISTRDSV